MGFQNVGKKCKKEKVYANDLWKSRENRPKNEASMVSNRWKIDQILNFYPKTTSGIRGWEVSENSVTSKKQNGRHISINFEPQYTVVIINEKK